MASKRPLLDPRFWLWLCLAAWPPELIAWALGWDLMAPGYVAVLLLWWPLDSLGRLGALRVVLAYGGAGRDVGTDDDPLADVETGGPVGRPYTTLADALPMALSAEISVGLRSSVLALLGLVPAAALLSLIGLDSTPKRWGLSLLALLGMVPAFVFLLKRLLAPILILRGQAASGRAALDASERQMRGKIGVFLGALLPWLAASWLLDLGSQALPASAALLTAPWSLALGLLGLEKGWRRLR